MIGTRDHSRSRARQVEAVLVGQPQIQQHHLGARLVASATASAARARLAELGSRATSATRAGTAASAARPRRPDQRARCAHGGVQCSACGHDGVMGTIGLSPVRRRQSASRRAPGNAPRRLGARGARQVELDRQHDHRDARVLQAALDQQRRLVVEHPVPERVLREDDLTGDHDDLRVPRTRPTASCSASTATSVPTRRRWSRGSPSASRNVRIREALRVRSSSAGISVGALEHVRVDDRDATNTTPWKCPGNMREQRQQRVPSQPAVAAHQQHRDRSPGSRSRRRARRPDSVQSAGVSAAPGSLRASAAPRRARGGRPPGSSGA